MAAADTTAALAIARLYAPNELSINGHPLNKSALQTFYAGRLYRLAWDCDQVGLGERAAMVLDILQAAAADGLDPADYHVDQIAALAGATSDADRLNRDLLISDGLLNYASDVSTGKLKPGQTDEHAPVAKIFASPQYLVSATKGNVLQLSVFLADLPPNAPEYRDLKGLLPVFRTFVDAGGWQALPDGGTIRPGARDPVVAALRQRLIAEDRISKDTKPGRQSEEDVYDSALSTAVALFQKQHGLKPDGTIGKDTRAALDVSAENRLHQVIVNLERIRWIGVAPVGRSVEVNLAAYGLKVFDNGNTVMTMPVVVGTRENPTPILFTQITTVVLNPNWTLPPNVIKEILPRMRENADYLAERGIAREESDGHTRLVQPPGPTNPLGRYKFVMPNDQDIYLHDTPDSAKFHYAARAYSHGCVRLGNPAELATFLLDDRTGQFPNGLDDVLKDGNTHHIALSKPIPVSLVYRTAWLDGDGNLVLGQDSYGRDPKLWKALHRPRGPASRKLAQRSDRSELL